MSGFVRTERNFKEMFNSLDIEKFKLYFCSPTLKKSDEITLHYVFSHLVDCLSYHHDSRKKVYSEMLTHIGQTMDTSVIDWHRHHSERIKLFRHADGLTGYVQNLESKRNLLNILVNHFREFDINHQDDDGLTYLMMAVAGDYTDSRMIHYLVGDLCADIHLKSKEYGRALQFINRTDIKMNDKFKALLQYGADPCEEIEFTSYGMHIGGGDIAEKYTSLQNYIELNVQSTATFQDAYRRRYDEVADIIQQFQKSKDSLQQSSSLLSPQRPASNRL